MAVAGISAAGLASFRSEARGIKFYDVLTSSVYVGQPLHLELEPHNQYDSDCVAVYVSSAGSRSMLGHLARESAEYLAPLLRAGFQGFG